MKKCSKGQFWVVILIGTTEELGDNEIRYLFMREGGGGRGETTGHGVPLTNHIVLCIQPGSSARARAGAWFRAGGLGGGRKGEGPRATENHSPATEYYEIQPGCSSRARAGAWVWAGGRGWRGGGGGYKY